MPSNRLKNHQLNIKIIVLHEVFVIYIYRNHKVIMNVENPRNYKTNDKLIKKTTTKTKIYISKSII